MRAILGHGGKVKAYIRDTSTGKELISAKGNGLLGYYNENLDQTLKPGGSLHSYGDCLMELLDDD